MIEATEAFDIRVAVILHHHDDGTVTGYPEYADHLRFTEASEAAVFRKILQAAADMYEEDK